MSDLLDNQVPRDELLALLEPYQGFGSANIDLITLPWGAYLRSNTTKGGLEVQTLFFARSGGTGASLAMGQGEAWLLLCRGNTTRPTLLVEPRSLVGRIRAWLARDRVALRGPVAKTHLARAIGGRAPSDVLDERACVVLTSPAGRPLGFEARGKELIVYAKTGAPGAPPPDFIEAASDLADALLGEG